MVAIPDPIARNVAITRGYHELALAVAALLGRDDANWLCFGQWASAEAGRAIRGESVPSFVRPIIGADVAEAVAGGNAAVFGDVGPVFVRFVRAFREDPAAARDPAVAQATLAGLLEHPQVAISADLQLACHAYADVLALTAATDPAAVRRRAQRMLVANASIGAHEQIVADPYIRAAIPGQSIIAIAATAHLGIRVPDGVLAFSRDVHPPGYLGGPMFPSDLIELEDDDAIALAGRFGQDLHSAVDSDAPNWEDYDERMGFIFTFLRAYQRDPAMFELPPEGH